MNIFSFPATLFNKGKDSIMQAFVNSLIRHSATTLGGALVSHGYLAADQAQLGIGALITLGAVAWSIFDKVSTSKALSA